MTTPQLPITVHTVQQLEKAMHQAYDRRCEYAALPAERRSADVLQMLGEEHDRKTEAWQQARAAFYAVCWADPDW